MKPDQLDLFLDIVPAKRKRGRPRKQAAEIIAFPMSRDQRAVRQMAEIMTRMAADDRNVFWRVHARNLMRELQDVGLTREAAREAVVEYTAAVRQLTRYLEADPARSGQRGS